MRDINCSICGDVCDEIGFIITKLKKQIEILEKSNEFYADEENWNIAGGLKVVDYPEDEKSGDGYRARQAKQRLKELREGSEG